MRPCGMAHNKTRGPWNSPFAGAPKATPTGRREHTSCTTNKPLVPLTQLMYRSSWWLSNCSPAVWQSSLSNKRCSGKNSPSSAILVLKLYAPSRHRRIISLCPSPPAGPHRLHPPLLGSGLLLLLPTGLLQLLLGRLGLTRPPQMGGLRRTPPPPPPHWAPAAGAPRPYAPSAPHATQLRTAIGGGGGGVQAILYGER